MEDEKQNEDEKLDEEVAEDAPHPTAGAGFPDKKWGAEETDAARGPGEAQVPGGDEQAMIERPAGGSGRPQSEAGGAETD